MHIEHNGAPLISLEAGLERILDGYMPLGEETVVLEEAKGRILACTVDARVDQPPFDKAAMDGYAWVGERVAEDGFELVGKVLAGDNWHGSIGPTDCVKIATGAPMPEGAKRVQRVEWTRLDGQRVRFTATEKDSNVIVRGSNQKVGDVVLYPRHLAAQDLAILASNGYDTVRVRQKPRVAVLSTGSEIVKAGELRPENAIFDSNSIYLQSALAAWGCDYRFAGIVPDSQEALKATLSHVLDWAQIVLLSGGVSMGDADYVPTVLEELGCTAIFHGLAISPGRRTFAGRLDNGTIVLGFPGNPLSVFIGFEYIFLPLLHVMAGIVYKPWVVSATLEGALDKQEVELCAFFPARLETENGQLIAKTLKAGGSSRLSILAAANCIIEVPRGIGAISTGRRIDARLIRSRN